MSRYLDGLSYNTIPSIWERQHTNVNSLFFNDIEPKTAEEALAKAAVYEALGNKREAEYWLNRAVGMEHFNK